MGIFWGDPSRQWPKGSATLLMALALKQLAKLRLGFRVPKRYRLLSRMKGETKPKSKQPNISALNFLTPDPFRLNRVANDQSLFGGPQFMACVTS